MFNISIISTLCVFDFSDFTLILAPIFGLFYLIYNLAVHIYVFVFEFIYNLALHIYGYVFYLFTFVSFNYHFCTDIFILFPILTICGISLIGAGFIISYSGAGKKIVEAIVKNAGTIGATGVGLVTGLDATLNIVER